MFGASRAGSLNVRRKAPPRGLTLTSSSWNFLPSKAIRAPPRRKMTIAQSHSRNRYLAHGKGTHIGLSLQLSAMKFAFFGYVGLANRRFLMTIFCSTPRSRRLQLPARVQSITSPNGVVWRGMSLQSSTPPKYRNTSGTAIRIMLCGSDGVRTIEIKQITRTEIRQ